MRAAVNGAALEGAIAAVLTSIMILLFLGSWGSTIMMVVSIPLSILGSITALARDGACITSEP